MPHLITGAEKNLAALRPRLFGDAVPPAVARRMGDVIRAANPDVDLDRLTPGTLLVIPDAPEVQIPNDLSLQGGPTEQLAGAYAQILAALDAVGAQGAAQEKARTVERRRVAKALDAVEPGKASGISRKALDGVRSTLEDEASAAKGQLAAFAQARKGWLADLDQLRSGLGAG